ncbi:MAG TPA: tetratricopeptide repeat protein, partial [Candidatus Hypogeohydataceae bacterium YC38]
MKPTTPAKGEEKLIPPVAEVIPSPIPKAEEEKVRGPLPEKGRISHHALGLEYLQKGMSQEAVNELKLAQEEDPKNAEVYYDLGRAYHKTKKLKEAVSAYKEALKIDPKHKKASILLKFIEKEGALVAAAPRPTPAPEKSVLPEIPPQEKAPLKETKPKEVTPPKKEVTLAEVLPPLEELRGEQAKKEEQKPVVTATEAEKKGELKQTAPVPPTKKPEASHHTMGLEYLQKGKAEDAIKEFKLAVEENP